MSRQYNLDQIETDRLLLLRPQLDHLEDVFEIHADPKTNLFNPNGAHLSIEKSQEILNQWILHWSANGFGYWTVTNKADRKIIGFGGIKMEQIESENVLSLYYRFNPSVWGLGYASEMSVACIDYIKTLGLTLPIVAVINPNNLSSVRVAKRVGMRLKRNIFYEIPSQLFVLE